MVPRPRATGSSGRTTGDGDRRASWRGPADADRWFGAERAGAARAVGARGRPPARWGLGARGALLEAGGPEARFDLDDRDLVWADVAPRLYAQAAARQWDPATAVPWDDAVRARRRTSRPRWCR